MGMEENSHYERGAQVLVEANSGEWGERFCLA